MNVKHEILQGCAPTRWLRPIACILLCFSLAACSFIPLRSLWALRNFDWQELDPQALRLLVWLPPALGTQAQAVEVKVSLTRQTQPEQTLETLLHFRPASLPANAELPQAPSTAGRWVNLPLDEASRQAVIQLRDKAAAWRVADGPDAKRKLSLTATPKLCIVTTAASAADWREQKMSVWLRWKAGQTYLLLLDQPRPQDVLPDDAPLPPACS